jgi:hypothetical protein
METFLDGKRYSMERNSNEMLAASLTLTIQEAPFAVKLSFIRQTEKWAEILDKELSDPIINEKHSFAHPQEFYSPLNKRSDILWLVDCHFGISYQWAW